MGCPPREMTPTDGGSLTQALSSDSFSIQTDEVDFKMEPHKQRQKFQDILPAHGQKSNSLLINKDEQHVPVLQGYSSNVSSANVNTNQSHQRHPKQEDKLFTKKSERILEETNEALRIAFNVLEEPIEAIGAGTQKTAEKMRRDEELGAMATISAVLYSNTQHPELKQTYPIWTDRCKQILKRWRSLSTEKKAPFLQKAKDNRSALRLRRTQQEHERSNAQNKLLKEQEQERIWKQHQAKIKEMSAEGLKIEGKTQDIQFKENGEKSPNKCSSGNEAIFSAKEDNNKLIAKTFLQTNISTAPIKNATVQICLSNASVGEGKNSTIEKGNKQLRTLLQKEPTPSTVYTSRDKLNEILVYTERKDHLEPKTEGNEIYDADNRNPSLCVGSKKFLIMNTSSKNKQQHQLINESARAKYGAQISDCSVSNVNESEKLDQDTESAGFVDILGGFGEDDDDELLKSLTTEMGDDFNILEYADPELDALANNQNLLSKLDFDDGSLIVLKKP